MRNGAEMAHRAVMLRERPRLSSVHRSRRAPGWWAWGDVFGGQPVGLGPAPAHGRVVLFDQAHHLVAKQAAHVQVIRRLGPVANHHIHIALGQVGVVVRIGRQGQDFNRAQGAWALIRATSWGRKSGSR